MKTCNLTSYFCFNYFWFVIRLTNTLQPLVQEQEKPESVQGYEQLVRRSVCGPSWCLPSQVPQFPPLSNCVFSFNSPMFPQILHIISWWKFSTVLADCTVYYQSTTYKWVRGTGDRGWHYQPQVPGSVRSSEMPLKSHTKWGGAKFRSLQYISKQFKVILESVTKRYVYRWKARRYRYPSVP